MVMDSEKNVRWIIPFKKFGMIRVKTTFNCTIGGILSGLHCKCKNWTELTKIGQRYVRLCDGESTQGMQTTPAARILINMLILWNPFFNG